MVKGDVEVEIKVPVSWETFRDVRERLKKITKLVGVDAGKRDKYGYVLLLMRKRGVVN